ncbi:MAG: hypothetical protein ACRCXL_08510 [Dermatophilaceae bacterium]
MEVSAGEDGLTSWWALLPTATAAAAWSAVDQLAADYRAQDDTLTVGESRADAFGDLVLRNVTVTAKVTLGIPVVVAEPIPGSSSRRADRPITSPPAAGREAAVAVVRSGPGIGADDAQARPTTGSTRQRLSLPLVRTTSPGCAADITG